MALLLSGRYADRFWADCRRRLGGVVSARQCIDDAGLTAQWSSQSDILSLIVFRIRLMYLLMYEKGNPAMAARQGSPEAPRDSD